MRNNPILVSVTHPGFLITLTCIRLIRYRNATAIVLIPKDFEDIYKKAAHSLVDEGIFAKVIEYDFWVGMSKNTREEVISELNSYFEKLLVDCDIQPENINELVACPDNYDAVTLWYSLHSNRILIVENTINGFDLKMRYSEAKRLCGASDAYTQLQIEQEILCNDSLKYNSLRIDGGSKCTEKTINVSDIFNYISNNDKEKILNAFEFNLTSEYFNKSQLIVLNSETYVSSETKAHYHSDFKKDTNDYFQLYLTLIDYLSDPRLKIIIKPHPLKEKISFFNKYGFHLLNSKPIELMNLVPGLKIPLMLNFGSSSELKIRNITHKIIYYDRIYEYYPYIHQFMFAVKLTSDYCASHKVCYNFEMDPLVVNSLITKNNPSYKGHPYRITSTKLEPNTITIISKQFEYARDLDLGENSLIIYYDGVPKTKSIPMIQFHLYIKNSFDSTFKELSTICVRCSDNELYKKISHYCYKYSLNYSDTTICTVVNRYPIEEKIQ